MFAVGRPAGAAGLAQRSLKAGDLAGRDIDHAQAGNAPAPVDIDIGDPRAVMRPGGTQRLGVDVGQPAILAGLHVADPQLWQAAALVGGIDQALAIGRPGRIGVERAILGQILRHPALGRHDIEIAERGKGDAAAIWRQGRVDNAQRLARRSRIPVALGAGVAGLHHLQRGGEVDGRQARALAAADLAVGHIIIAALPPGHTEGEDILGAADGLAIDFETAPLRVLHHIGKLAAGAEGRGIDLALHLLQQAFLPIGEGRDIKGGLGAIRPGIGDARAVGRPAGHAILAPVAANLLHRAAGDVQRPNVVIAAAVGREGNRLAIGRPGRLAIIIGALGQLAHLAAVRLDRPEIIIAVAIGKIGEARTVRRPDRLAGIVEIVGDPLRLAAAGRDDPQAPLKVHGQPFAVGRHRHRHRRAFMHIEGNRGLAAGRGQIGGLSIGLDGARRQQGQRQKLEGRFHRIDPLTNQIYSVRGGRPRRRAACRCPAPRR